MDKPNARQQLDSLVSLITSSIAQISTEYENAGLPAPSLNADSADIFQNSDEDAKQRVDRSTKTLVGACAQLSATVMRPHRAVLSKIFAFEESAALQIAASANIAGLLRDRPDGLHVDELSSMSGINTDKLSRILRFLTINHIFSEVAPNVYANNKLSLSLYSQSAIDIALHSIPTGRVANRLPEYVLNHASETDYKSPFHLTFGAPIMEYHHTPEGAKTVPTFMKGVAGWGKLTGKVESLLVFPWPKHFSASEPITICDVGAGDGHAMLSLMRIYDSFRFRAVVQDRPAFVDLSKNLFAKELPSALDESRVDFLPFDFFVEGPVSGCEIYYIRHCMHNWPDDKCLIILRNIAQAMRKTPGSILLIHEVVLRNAVRSSKQATTDAQTDENVAPEPLLPNFGVGSYLQYIADMNMMNLTNAKERTLDEFIALGAEIGFRFMHMYDAGQTSILEFKLDK